MKWRNKRREKSGVRVEEEVGLWWRGGGGGGGRVVVEREEEEEVELW